jgi:hypothetical protein
MRKTLKFRAVTVETPEDKFKANFRYTSHLGYSGCEGFVQPGILKMDGQKRLVQTKTFYRETCDDRCNQFTQDPTKKVHESYEALRELRQLGFRVMPFFGIMRFPGGTPILVMCDLREGQTIEVYDEKHVHNSREVTNIINGRKKKMRADKAVIGLENWPEIRLSFLHTSLLSTAHSIDFGMAGGTEHMITRDPKTNRWEIFVCDVGEFHKNKDKYSEALPAKQFIDVPEKEILRLYTQMLSELHPGQKAEKLYESFRTNNPRKNRFLNLLFQATAGMSLREHIGGWYRDAEFARRIFPINHFPDVFMKTKLHFRNLAGCYEETTGEKLYECNSEAAQKLAGATGRKDLWRGIEFAQLATLDQRIRQILAAKTAFDSGKPAEETPPITVKKGFPEYTFFEGPDKKVPSTLIVRLSPSSWWATRDTQYSLHVEFDTTTAYYIETSAGTCFIPPFTVEQVKGIEVNGEPIMNFDSRKIKMCTRDFGGTDIFYGKDPVYWLPRKNTERNNPNI